MALHLLLKGVSFPMGLPNSFTQFLHILVGSGHGYWSQGKSEGDIDRESGLSPIHQVIGAEPHGGISGTVVSMDQCSNTALQLDFHSGGSVLNILVKVELNLFYWPFVWGWYGLVLSYFVPLNFQRSAISSLSKFLPWLERIFSGNP